MHVASLLETKVVISADPGEDRNLFTPEAHDTPLPAPHHQADVSGTQSFPPYPQIIGQAA
jgi:hypothetical protein